MTDSELLGVEAFFHVASGNAFDLLAPMPKMKSYMNDIRSIPADQFTQRWAGFATLIRPFKFFKVEHQLPLFQIVQRCAENQNDYEFKPFLSTSSTNEVQAISQQYPQRWNIEEFFKNTQDYGWHKAGTLNLNIRYAQMTLALVAQAAVYQLKQKLGEPYSSWDAQHFAKNLLGGLEGDIRVKNDTILVTYYNAPNTKKLKSLLENTPLKLSQKNINPKIPWLFDFKLDFKFK